MRIAIASGKGGTGKTLIATHLAAALRAAYVDCDVEGANGHLFLKPEIVDQRPASVEVPEATDACTGCGACAKVCRFGALAALKSGVLVFNELCHSCGACLEACRSGALRWATHRLGRVRTGTYRAGDGPAVAFADGELATGQVRASAVIAQVKQAAAEAPLAVLDCPPGCSCAAAESLRGADLCLLVTEPTPFGLSDLEKALDLARHLGLPHAVILNRSDLAGTDARAFCRDRGAPIVMEYPHDAGVARAYAEGRLAGESVPALREAIARLAGALRDGTLDLGRPPAEPAAPAPPLLEGDRPDAPAAQEAETGSLVRVAVISGKGGTGKTTLAASLAATGPRVAVADADVDAANLHLLLGPAHEVSAPFSGGGVALIDPLKCRGCGVCANECRFDAIALTPRPTVDPLRCEGCGLCALVCPLAGTEEMPIRIRPRLSGHAHMGQTAWGPMARGSLLAGGEASGKLVTWVRALAEAGADHAAANYVLVDASPGMGCPVNAGLTGCTMAVAVTEPTPSGLHDLERVLDLADWFTVPAVVVINKADLGPDMAARIRATCASRGVEVIGQIPFDRRVPEDLGRGVIPALGDGPAAEALRRICQRVQDRVADRAGGRGAGEAPAPQARRSPR